MKVAYTGIVINKPDQAKLLSLFQPPLGWENKCHHMTINLGDSSCAPKPIVVGESVKLRVVGFAKDERVSAVSVECDIPSVNERKHITVGVNRRVGGKPFHSNELRDWMLLDDPIEIEGVIAECGAGDVVLKN